MSTSSLGGLFLRLRVRLGVRLAALRACAALLVAMRRRRRATELWIGDSHALSFNQKVSYAQFVRAPEGQVVLRIGPRLMWSLAEKGFPERAHRVVRIVAKYGIPGSIVPFFVSGEVDVRCHLVGREDDYGFVKKYVDRCLELATALGSPRAVFVVPPPPSEWCPNVEEFPIKGSIGERVAVFGSMRAALVDAVAATPGAELLDATDGLAGEDGAIRRELTDDGCHTNLAGVGVVRARARQLDVRVRP